MCTFKVLECSKDDSFLVNSRDVSECVIDKDYMLTRKGLLKIFLARIKDRMSFSFNVVATNDCEKIFYIVQFMFL